MQPQILIHPNTGRAPIQGLATNRTLPGWAYTDPALWQAEKAQIFFRSWQYACHISELPQPGSYVTTSIFDQDIVIVRGQDGALRAFYNVCAHRGHQLVEGSGQAGRLVCPYHAWTYALDGRLVGVRRGAATTKIDKSGICLTAVQTGSFLGLVFVNLDPEAEPLETFAAGLADEIAAAIPGAESFRPKSGRTTVERPMQCNWKLIVENYLECYHCETAHPTFCDMFRTGEVKHSFAANHMRQHLPSAGKSETKAYRIDLEHDLLDGNYWFLFPNTLIGQSPGTPGIAVSRIIASTPETATRQFHMLVAPDFDPARFEARTRFSATMVGAEDKALCESVQKGMRQKGFSQGHYVIDPEQENFTEEGVRFFHRRYAKAMEGVLPTVAG